MSERKPEFPRESAAEMQPSTPKLLGIYTAPAMGQPMELHQSIRVIKDEGLEGDRYAKRQGAYSEARIGRPGRIPDANRQITLIATGGIEDANQQLEHMGIKRFTPGETRRNLLLHMSAEELNALVGKRFRIGEVEFEAVEECDPCTRPTIVSPDPERKKQDGKAFETAFAHRGGIRARALTTGEIHAQDALVVLDLPAQS